VAILATRGDIAKHRSPDKFLKELMDVRARGVRAYSHSPELQKLMRTKEAKVLSYRQQCREVWLLIVARGFEPSTFGDLGPEVEGYLFESGFDRVFFLHYFDGSVSELHLRCAA
jgi:hypothetical protein